MSTIKENGVFHGLMYTLFLNLSAQLTKELGMAPGGEFRRALAEVSLGSQDVILALMKELLMASNQDAILVLL